MGGLGAADTAQRRGAAKTKRKVDGVRTNTVITRKEKARLALHALEKLQMISEVFDLIHWHQALSGSSVTTARAFKTQWRSARGASSAARTPRTAH
jgi:hypothetical protein